MLPPKYRFPPCPRRRVPLAAELNAPRARWQVQPSRGPLYRSDAWPRRATGPVPATQESGGAADAETGRDPQCLPPRRSRDALRFVPMPTADATALQAGAPDANGQSPEVARRERERRSLPPLPQADRGGRALPHPRLPAVSRAAALCRGRADLPPCRGVPEATTRPPSCRRFSGRTERASSAATATTTASSMAAAGWSPMRRSREEADALFGDPRIAYIHVRSAANNCYQCRIDRG